MGCQRKIKRRGRSTVAALRLVTAALSLAMLSGCETLEFRPLPPIHEQHVNYSAGETLTATLGAEMVSVENLYYRPKYKPLYTFQPSPVLLFDRPVIDPDQEWVALYTYKDNYFVCSFFFARDIGMEIDKDGNVVNDKPFVNTSPMVMDGRNKTVRVVQTKNELPNRHLFDRAGISIEKGSYKFALVYGGKFEDNIIDLIVREYSDNFHNSVRTDDKRFKVPVDGVIAYKSLKIKVLEATGSSISYQVLEDGGLPWLFDHKE